jgi:hypothetical protein
MRPITVLWDTEGTLHSKERSKKDLTQRGEGEAKEVGIVDKCWCS